MSVKVINTISVKRTYHMFYIKANMNFTRLCLLNIEKFAKGTFTWVNNNSVNEISVIDYMFSNYDFLPNVVSFE